MFLEGTGLIVRILPKQMAELRTLPPDKASTIPLEGLMCVLQHSSPSSQNHLSWDVFASPLPTLTHNLISHSRS